MRMQQWTLVIVLIVASQVITPAPTTTAAPGTNTSTLSPSVPSPTLPSDADESVTTKSLSTTTTVNAQLNTTLAANTPSGESSSTTSLSATPTGPSTPTPTPTSTSTPKPTTTTPTECESKPPGLENGSFLPNKTSYFFNDIVTYTCDPGYKLKSENASSTCTDTGTWKPEQPAICLRKECGSKPPGLENGSFSPNKTSYFFNDIVTYTCDPGYKLKSENASSTCTDTGTWKPDQPAICLRKKCSAPSIPEHGKIEPDGQEDYWVNTKVAYSCYPGYHLSGSTTATCMESTEWSHKAPNCTLIKIAYNGTCIKTGPADQCKTDNAQCLKLDNRNTSRCLCKQTFFHYNDSSCVKKIDYNVSCNESLPANQCLTDNAHCLKLSEQTTAKCQCNKTFFYKDMACVKKIAYNGSCNETWTADQCQTDNAQCLKLDDQNIWTTCRCNQTFFYNKTSCEKKIAYNGNCAKEGPVDQCKTHNAQCLHQEDQSTWTCRCNDTFFHYNDTICVKKIDYKVTDLDINIKTDQTKERTATLAWKTDTNTPNYWYFVAVVQNKDGDEVTNFTEYYNLAPNKSTVFKGLEPGHNYWVVIHVYNYNGIPSLLNETLNFCTRPLSVAINMKNFTETSFSITWDYNTSNVFSTLVITLTSTRQLPDDAFINCPGQQHGVCTLPRNYSLKYLHVQNLTQGTLYNVSIYTIACDSGPHSLENQNSLYTVPSLPEFTVEDFGPGITANSVTVKWADNDGSKTGQFHEWHAVVRYNSSTIVKNETFENDSLEKTINGLSSATKYTLEFYTTVPGQNSITSPKILFYTRPKDVAAAKVKPVHETNLTVSIPGQADNDDVFFRVIVASYENYHDDRNVTNDTRSVTVTGLTAATNYTISVYAVLKKNNGTLLQSTNAFVTWSFSGPPPPAKVTIDAIEGDTLAFTPSVNIAQKVTYDVLYESISGPSSSGHTDNVSGQIKLVNLTMGTRYRILIYTKLIQTAEPNIIKGGRSYEFTTYTRPPAIIEATIHVTSTTNNSLTIKWDAPTVGDVNNYQYNGTFSCTSPNDDRQTTTQPISLTNKYTAEATRLDPGSNCSVVIQTIVEGLVSDDFYKILTQKNDETAPGQVRIVQISSEAATRVAVEWKDPSKRNGVIQHYEIIIPKYKNDTCEPGNPLDETEIECYRIIVFNCRDCTPVENALTTAATHTVTPICGAIEVGGNFGKGEESFSHAIAGLHAYMNYSVEIAAYTFTRGLAYKKTVETSESTPGAPRNVHGNPDSSSALTLHWDPPACGKRNGVLGDYTITYKYRDNTVCVDQSGANNITKSIPGINDTAHTLSDLKAFWKYSLSVVASTSQGNGESNNATTVTTLEDVPDIVRSINSTAKTAASLQLFWSQPCFPNGILTNYTILLNNTDKGGSVLAYYSGTNTSMTITDLLPYRNYTVTIWGNTAEHSGHKADPIQKRTAVGVPHAPTGVVGDVMSFKEVEVRWNNTFYTGPTHYTAFVANNSSLNCETGIDHTASSCTIGGLKPYSNYTFVVTAFTSAGSVNSSESGRVLTDQFVPGVVTSVDVKPEGNVTQERSITVVWAPPKHGDRHGIIIGYVIKAVTSRMDVICTTHASNQTLAKCSGAVKISCTSAKQANGDYNWTCTLKSIITGDYNVTVRAKTRIGAGPPIQEPTSVEPGAPLNLAGATEDQSIVQPGRTSVGDPKRQVAVKFPRGVICNEDNGKPSSWGIVVAEESMATDPPFVGTLTDFNKGRIGDTYKTWFQVDHDGNMAPYIATTKTWNPCKAADGSRSKRSATSENVYFIVGESDKCSGAPPGDRCNGELVPDKSYRVKAFACTDGGCTETKYSPPITTDALFPVAMVAGVTSAVLVVIAIVVTIVMKRRQMFCFRKSIDEESTHRSEPPVSSSEMKNISVTSNSHVFKPGPVKLVDFPGYVDRLHRDSNMIFSDAYKMAKEECAHHPMTAAESQRNRLKNRYTNILSYDHSRVKLLPVDDDDDSDYINANYIPGYTSKREYIATQGPLVATLNDFWRMVWEQNVDTIVMLTKLVEKGRPKCDKYWPELNEPVYYGDLVVGVQSESHLSDYTIRVMEVKLKSSRRLVRQFCYLKWPDMGCPDQPSHLIDFVKSVKEYTNANSSKKGPMIVHCSAGVGRTGTFIAVDYLLQYIRDHDDIDIYKLVLEMRNYRCNMVQTEDQYVYIHECMKEFITVDDDDDDDDEPVYVNAPTQDENVYENTAFTADL